MPAFAQRAGGMLTDDQINVVAKGIRAHWAKPDARAAAIPRPTNRKTPGDAKRGAAVYDMYCSSCHGADGRGGSKASSIVDPAYLSLVSDQNLRTTVIAGRPEMGAPDWRGNVPGKPMSPEDVSDVVAWLAAQRPPRRKSMSVPDEVSRRGMLAKLGILFNGAVGLILAVPIVRYLLSPVIRQKSAGIRVLALARSARSVPGGRDAAGDLSQSGGESVGWRNREHPLLGPSRGW